MWLLCVMCYVMYFHMCYALDVVLLMIRYDMLCIVMLCY